LVTVTDNYLGLNLHQYSTESIYAIIAFRWLQLTARGF